MATVLEELQACKVVGDLLAQRSVLDRRLSTAAVSGNDEEFCAAEDALADFDAAHPWLADAVKQL